jgi:DNA-binding MarR family transcriptional regulator
MAGDPRASAAPVVVDATAEQEFLSTTAVTVFRLHGRVLALAETLARPAGLTAAWWQVLGAVLPAPLPVSGIAREMGISRQSVQRIADLLVGRGLAEYVPNPAHRRAKLVAPTAAGRTAIGRIGPQHAEAALELATHLSVEDRVDTLARLTALLDAFEALTADAPD